MKKKLFILSLVGVILLAGFLYIKPPLENQQHKVADRIAEIEIAGDEVIEEQPVGLASPAKQGDQKIVQVDKFKKVFKKVIDEAFAGFKDKESSYEKVLESFKSLGVDPRIIETDIDESYINGAKSINGLRYFTARYEDLGKSPKFVSFELEPFKSGFEHAKENIKNFYSAIVKPCFESKDSKSVAYKDKDGKHVISIYEITPENIDLDSMNPPRTNEDLGSVVVSIENSTSDDHGSACGE